jgi:pimeloyl-ACP methyl ester carboxylesterase
MNSMAATGYFDNGLPYNRYGHGPHTLVVFQGLLFENKPMPGRLSSLFPRTYGFLEDEYTTWIVLRKPRLPEGYTLRDMSDDYAVAIRREFGQAVDVIGLSTGGSIAQHFAADHSDLVRRLVLHSSAYKLSEAGKAYQLRLEHLARERRWRAAYSETFHFMFDRDGSRNLPADGAVWLESLVAGWLMAPDDPSALVVTIEAEDKHDFKRRLGEIAVPTLVVAGDSDPFYGAELFRDTAAGIPNAKLILYEGMGHPAAGSRFHRDVREFLLAGVEQETAEAASPAA